MLCFYYYYYPHLYFISCLLINFVTYAEAVFLLHGLEGLDYIDYNLENKQKIEVLFRRHLRFRESEILNNNLYIAV